MTKNTKERLIDAAEHLFAQNGYHNTSLRAVTSKARANIAAVNYHFGSKEALITAVLERRLMPLNELRQQRLAAVRTRAEKAGTRPQVSEIMSAFVEPTLLFKAADINTHDFIALIGRSLAEPDTTIRAIFLRIVGPFFQEVFDLLAFALPEMDRATLHLRLHFIIGALSHTMQMYGRWPELLSRSRPEDNVATLVNELVTFVTAGIEA